MKAVIFDIKRFALHDGPGIRTTVFFKGCPLACRWCHNPESHSMEPESYREERLIDGKRLEIERTYGQETETGWLLDELLRDRVFFDQSGGGVTLSGGEPLMQFDAAMELLSLMGREGVHRTVDTAGHVAAEQITAAAAQTDLFLYDLKVMDPEKHREYTGVDNRLILENADRLLDAGAKVIFRIPVVPGVNDSAAEIAAFRDYLHVRKERIPEVHLLPFHRTGNAKYRRMARENAFSMTQPPDEKMLKQMQRTIESGGGPLVRIGG